MPTDATARKTAKPPAAARRAVIDWAESNITTVKAEWNRINPRYPVK